MGKEFGVKLALSTYFMQPPPPANFPRQPAATGVRKTRMALSYFDGN